VYIFVAACMGLASFKFVQWAPKDASFLHQRAPECVLGVQGRSGSFKVDEFGFGINRTRVCDFLLVGHCNYGSILHRF